MWRKPPMSGLSYEELSVLNDASSGLGIVLDRG